MQQGYSRRFVKAAKAAGVGPEKFAKQIRGLLSPSKCRDTRRRIFTPQMLKALKCA